MSAQSNRSSGGTAMHSGASYQDRVAAWMAVCILAEQAATPPWDLPAGITLESVRCESEQPTDDVNVGTSVDGFAFIQAKHAIALEQAPGSDLGKALDQLVEQFITCREATNGNLPWERPLDPGKDRLVLATSLRSSAPILEHLPTVLVRLRRLSPQQTINDAAQTEAERRALRVVRAHLDRKWNDLRGNRPTDDEVRALLNLLYVQALDVDAGGIGEREAKNLLRQAVLRDPTQADVAWTTLVQDCATQASIGVMGADRRSLQQSLLNVGISLQAVRSYRADIYRLKEHSQMTLNALSALSRIHLTSIDVKIVREPASELEIAVADGSLAVVGDPGSGKSGMIYDLAEKLDRDGHDVVCFAADQLDAQSLGTLRNELGIHHELDDVLNNWPGTGPGYVFIDGLDAARSEASARTLRELISRIINAGTRWRVIASIRKFDLRYSPDLQRLFGGTPPTNYRDAEFAMVRHFSVLALSPAEVGQVGSQSHELAELLQRAGPDLRTLLTVPFNLRLAADLLDAGASVADLTPIRTQVELLDLYWRERIIRSDGLGDAREAVLRLAVGSMIASRSLRINRAVVASDPAASPALQAVLSAHVLMEWPHPSGQRPDRATLTFGHNLLFDYAAAYLVLRGVQPSERQFLESHPDAIMFIRPSIVLHFQHLWSLQVDRMPFWDVLFDVMQSPTISEIGKLAGLEVAAVSITQPSDFDPLVTRLEAADPLTRKTADQVLGHLVGTLLALPLDANRPLVGPGAPPWCDFLARSSRCLRPSVVGAVRALLKEICQQPDDLTVDQKALTGVAARRLLEFAWK